MEATVRLLWIMAFFLLSSLPSQADDRLRCGLIDCDCSYFESRDLITSSMRQLCFENQRNMVRKCGQGKAKFGACDYESHGPAAWPTAFGPKDPPIGEIVDSVVSRVRKATALKPSKRREVERSQLDRLERYEATLPGVKSLTGPTRAKIDLDEANRVTSNALKVLRRLDKGASGVTKEDIKALGKFILRSQSQIEATSPVNNGLLKEAYETVKKLNAKGINFLDLFGVEDKGSLEYLQRLSGWADKVLTVQEMAERDRLDADTFIDEALSLIPEGLAPALQSPQAEYLKDLLKWDSKMFGKTTEALNVLSEGLESGDLNDDRLDQLINDIEKLGDEGPWKDTGRSFIRKLVDKIPVLNKIVDLFW